MDSLVEPTSFFSAPPFLRALHGPTCFTALRHSFHLALAFVVAVVITCSFPLGF